MIVFYFVKIFRCYRQQWLGLDLFYSADISGGGSVTNMGERGGGVFDRK